MLSVKKRYLYFLFVFSALALNSTAQKKEWYEIKLYHCSGNVQVQQVDAFLQTAYLPALHRAGIKNVGVFKPIENDTIADKRIYILIPFQSFKQTAELPEKLQKDMQYATDGKDYFNAPYNNPPYTRMESVLLQAFDSMPLLQSPHFSTPASERIYELRSYEGATENIHANKMEMFNKGNEFSIFKHLGFNTIFCGEVFAGSHMPNLMYMTSFENMLSHDEHWKNFVADTEWKKLSAMPQYQNNVSHIDIILMHPTVYSDF